MIKHNLNDTFPQKYIQKNCKNVGKTCFILSKKQDNVFEKHIYILTKKNCTFQCNFRKFVRFSDMFIQ